MKKPLSAAINTALSPADHKSVRIWAATNEVQVSPLVRSLLTRAATDPQFSRRLLALAKE